MSIERKASKRRILRLPAEPQNVFLLLAAIFGLVMVFVTPPALVGDEPNHFFRAYQISDGAIVGERMQDGGGSGGWIPRNVLHTNRKLVGEIEMNHHIKFDTNLIWELRQLPVGEEDKLFVPFHNTVVYAPVPYIPQVLGIYIGKVFGASPLALIYIARVVNLIFFLAFAYFAIRITPVHKWTFCFLWLTPTTVFQAASAAADPFMMGSCFLTIAFFLYCALDKDSRIDKLDILKIFVLCLLAALGKQAYILLPFLFLLIPRRKFKSAVVYWLTFFALLVVCFGVVGGWAALMKPIFQSYRGDIVVNPDEQLSFVLHNPFTFLGVVFNSFVRLGGYYFVTFFGGLTWLDLLLPQWLTVFLFLMATAIALLDKNFEINITWLHKAVFAAVFAGTVLLVSLLLYLSWSPIAGDRVAGIQGRYFIPVAPLFFLLFYNRKWKWEKFNRHIPKIVCATVVFSLLFMVYSVIKRYYIPS